MYVPKLEGSGVEFFIQLVYNILHTKSLLLPKDVMCDEFSIMIFNLIISNKLLIKIKVVIQVFG